MKYQESLDLMHDDVGLLAKCICTTLREPTGWKKSRFTFSSKASLCTALCHGWPEGRVGVKLRLMGMFKTLDKSLTVRNHLPLGDSGRCGHEFEYYCFDGKRPPQSTKRQPLTWWERIRLTCIRSSKLPCSTHASNTPSTPKSPMQSLVTPTKAGAISWSRHFLTVRHYVVHIQPLTMVVAQSGYLAMHDSLIRCRTAHLR